jgi:hypothetical protein
MEKNFSHKNTVGVKLSKAMNLTSNASESPKTIKEQELDEFYQESSDELEYWEEFKPSISVFSPCDNSPAPSFAQNQTNFGSSAFGKFLSDPLSPSEILDRDLTIKKLKKLLKNEKELNLKLNKRINRIYKKFEEEKLVV